MLKERLLSFSGSEPSTTRTKILRGLEPVSGLRGIAGLHGKLLVHGWPWTVLASSTNIKVTQCPASTYTVYLLVL